MCTKPGSRLVRSDLRAKLRIDHFSWGSFANKAQSALFSESVPLGPRRLVDVDTSGSFCISQKGRGSAFEVHDECSPTEAVAMESKELGAFPGVPWILTCVGREGGCRAVYSHLLFTVFSILRLHRALNLHVHAQTCLLVT